MALFPMYLSDTLIGKKCHFKTASNSGCIGSVQNSNKKSGSLFFSFVHVLLTRISIIWYGPKGGDAELSMKWHGFDPPRPTGWVVSGRDFAVFDGLDWVE